MKISRFISRRSVRICAALFIPLVIASSLPAQTVIDRNGFRRNGAVIDEYVFYRVGGGRAGSMTRAPGMTSYGVGARWNQNLICGDMRLDVTLQNQLNGLTEGFEQIMSTVIQNATAAVASLPALILQRANPALYNLLMNGVLQARLDYDRSKLTCRAIGNKMADVAMEQIDWSALAEGFALQEAVAEGDAVAAIEEAESSRGNGGVPWIAGENAGGENQPAIRLLSDVTMAGYNLSNNRPVNDQTPIDAEACDGRLLCRTWPSPAAAATWAVRVLGESTRRTCDACIKTEAVAGVGLTPLIQDEYDQKLEVIEALVTGAEPTSIENLEAAGSDAVPVTRGVVEALRSDPDQDLLAKRLASEVALSSVMEQALLLQRVLRAGLREPNVSANKLAQSAILQEISSLQQEIDGLRAELEVRRTLAGNSPIAILERDSARTGGSRSVTQGDTATNRLDLIQRPDTIVPP